MVVLAAVGFLAALPVAATEADDGPMTLRDCLLYARSHAHANRIAGLESRSAKADVSSAVSSMMPNIGLSTNGNISFGRNIDPETNTYDNKKTLSTGFGLNLSMPLFDGLVRINRLKAAKVARLRSLSAEAEQQDRVSLEVIRAFYNISYCKAMVRQMESQLRLDSTDLRVAERGFELGIKSGAEVAEMEALVATDRFNLTNRSNILRKAYLDLRAAMGMELTADSLILTETLRHSTGTTSGRINPKLAGAMHAVKESRYSLRAAKGDWLPTLSLSAGVSTSYWRMMGTGVSAPGFSRQWRDNLGQYIGLSLSIPVFDGLATSNRVKKARISLMESETRLEQTRYELEKETAEARLDYEGACEELRAASLRLEAEKTAYQAIRRKFELGGASVTDLYTSGAKLAEATAEMEAKRIQRIISEITLAYCQGEPLIQE